MRKRRKRRHALNPIGWIESPAAKKIAAGVGIWAASLFTVQKKASVETAAAVDHAQASTSIAVYAAESVDSLRVDMERLRRRVYVLEHAAGKDNLAEAREVIARPRARQAPQSWWRRIIGG